ncbi:uncharacterized protein Fot_21585 [Forsythia ovata]|uniref:Replication factor A C-terminal domain-containing protein n=1 Tax=Forsythia ovata TaxID=205694 RepID=A0ABD1UV97_9LAMI
MNEKRCKRRRELYAERKQLRCDGRRSTRFAVENAMYMSAYEISESNEVDGVDVERSENIRKEYGEQAGFDEIEIVGQIFERQHEGSPAKLKELPSKNHPKDIENLTICISSILAIAIDMRPKRQIQTLCGGQSTVQEIILINNRIDNHMERLDAIISKKSYLRFSSSNLLAPAEDKYTKIQSIQDLLFVQKFFWVKATVSIIRPLRQSLWYMACNNCNKVASVNFNEVYECIYCKCPQARATTRARAYVELRDLTGSINAAIIGEPAEKFLQCTADKLMQEDANPDILQVVRTTTGEDYILYVKALNNDPSVGQIKYEVVFILHPVSVQEMPTNTERNSLENLLTTSKEIPNEENSKSVTIPVRRALILPQIKFDQNQKDKQKMYEDDDVFLHPFAETEIQTPAQTNKYDDFSDHEPCPKC